MRLRLSAMVLSLFAAACVDDGVSVFVKGVIAPEMNEDSCTWDPNSDVFIVPPGVLDVETDLVLGSNVDYRVVLSTANQLQPRGGSGRAETNGVQITRAEITLRGLDGNPINLGGLPNPFSVPTSAYIPPASDPTNPGTGAVAVTAIPAAYATAMANGFPRDADGNLVATQILLGIKLIGETQGHIDIEMAEWQWPVSICGLCLFRCAADGESPLFGCVPGQDAQTILPSDFLGCPF